MKRSLPLVLFLLASACASAPPPASAPVHVVLVGTTDVHGWFAGHIDTGVVWGGTPALARYVNILRAENPGRVLVVDSGDMWQGTLESNMSEGEAVVRAYNAIGYVAAAVGNHEFDYGPPGPDAIARKLSQDALGALKHNAALAKFPLLSANMVEKSNGRTPAWAKQSVMVDVQGAKVGIIGLSTPDTPNVTMGANVVSLAFSDPVEATVRVAKELRDKGADAVIVIAHMGGRCKDMNDVHDVDSCEKGHESMDYLAKLPPGTIDAFFAGHTHSQMRQIINGVPAVQAGPFSREFSTVDLWVDPAANKVTKSEIRPHTMICTHVYEGTQQCDPRNAPAGAKLVPRVFEGVTIENDTKVAAVIDPYLRRVAAKREENVGIRASERMPRSLVGESSLGNLLADALREYAATDFGMMNSGGIRADLPAKDLIYADVFAVSPFDNFPAVVKMTGKQIAETLRVTATGVRGIMQVSGLRYTIDTTKDADKAPAERNRVLDITTADGSALDPDKVYTVAMPDFIAAGGDGTQDVMAQIPRENINISYARPIRDILVEMWHKRPQPLQAKIEGRITIVNPPQPPAAP